MISFIACAPLTSRPAFLGTSASPSTPRTRSPSRLSRAIQVTATATQPSKTDVSSEPRAPEPGLAPAQATKSPSLPAGLENAVPYFAYFSNMNPNKIGPMSRIPLRRFPILHSAVAILDNHRLVFNLPGLPPEPANANIEPSRGSQVHGIVHWVKRDEFQRLSLSEGVPPEDSPLNALPDLLKVGCTEQLTVSVRTGPSEEDSVDVRAKTFVFYGRRTPKFIRNAIRPSRRYVQVAIDGAEFWGIDQSYVTDVLKKLETATGFAGGFGLRVEQRPHILDRPNPNVNFGKASTEIYSPWQPIRAKRAVKVFEENEESGDDSKLSLLFLSDASKDLATERRKLYYIPGIDGSGKSILSQVENIDEDGEWALSSVKYPFGNRQSPQELASSILELIYDDAKGDPVSIIGESMGGALAVMVSHENIRRKRVQEQKTLDIDLALMINPATCYKRSVARPLWEFLLSIGFTHEQYTVLMPFILLPFILDPDSVTQDIGPDLVPRLRNMLAALSKMADILPQDALSHRMGILSDCAMSGQELSELTHEFGPNEIGVISTVNDNLIPSLSENYRLQRYIPNIYSAVLPYGGHSPMFDKRFVLPDLLRPFKNGLRKNTESTSQETVSPKLEKRRDAMRKKLAKNSTDTNPTADKSRTEMSKLKSFLGRWNTECSPVFIGEENLPEPSDGKPVLFISNHTLLGWLDGTYPSMRILSSKKTLLRPLAHPLLFRSETVLLPGTTTVSLDEVSELGVVSVSPSALLEQLSKGNWCMLFPGGAREALKGQSDEKYSLHWPASPEFIRPCALFGATIIPVSTVGAEDMVKLLVDTEAMGNFVRTANDALGRPIDVESVFGDNSQAWRYQSTSGRPLVVPPLAVPAPPDRLYYRFGKPIEVPAECLNDSTLSMSIYKRVKEDVADGVQILLRRREADAYRSLEKRKKFWQSCDESIDPPASPAWLWTKGLGAYLDENLQPPL